MDTLPGCILITDTRGKILYANASVSSKTGFSKEEILGKKPGELWGGHMDRDFYKKMWGTLQVKKLPFMAEVENTRKDGSSLRENLYISPVLSAQGDVDYFIELQPLLHSAADEQKFQSDFNKLMSKQGLDSGLLMKQLIEWSSEKNKIGSVDALKQAGTHSDFSSLLGQLFLSYGRSAQLDDAQLVEAAKKDPERFAALYNKYRDRIYNYLLYRVSKDSRVAEELLQETFARAFHGLSQFKTQDYTYLSYLLVIAHNLLINYYRSPKPIYVEDMSVFKTSDALEKEEAFGKEDMWNDLENLSEAEKTAVLMKYKNDKSIKNIAEEMGKSENAVKLLLSRARKKLRTK